MSKSIMQSEKVCLVCGSPYVEEHHCIPGNPGRRLSEKYGLKVYLCHSHHNEPPYGVHFDQNFMRQLQREAQRAFEETHTRDEFMALFMRNYLE